MGFQGNPKNHKIQVQICWLGFETRQSLCFAKRWVSKATKRATKLLAFWVPCLALKLVILLVTCFLCKKIWQDHDNQHKHEERPKGRERERERDVKICYHVTFRNHCCHQRHLMTWNLKCAGDTGHVSFDVFIC